MTKSLALALALTSTCFAIVTRAQAPAVEGRWHTTFKVDRDGKNDPPAELVISVDEERVSGMLGDVQIRGTFREGKLTFTTPKGQFYDSYEGTIQIDGTLVGEASRASYSTSDRGYWLKVMGMWTAIRKGTTLEDADSAEDRRVLTAVIDHTIRPKVQKVTPGPPVVVFILDNTAPVCDRIRWPRSRPLCMPGIAEGQPTFLNDHPSNGFYLYFAEVVPSAAHRAELWASVRARNAVRHALPVSEGRDVKLVGAPPVSQAPLGEAFSIYTLLSLPGYTSDGDAVVSAFIDCGGPASERWNAAFAGSQCGGVFLWLLEKRGADWQVRARYNVTGTDADIGRPVLYNPPLSK